jgi:N6-L-threonylcarbamoyladenine synthase
MFKEISREHNAVFKVVDRRFTADCGAQIAWTGILAYKAGVILNVSESAVKPRWRIDQVPIPWRGDGICV